jgi:hypothetical protein
MAIALRDPSSMTDAELLAEISRLEAEDDRASLSDPSSLLLRTMPVYRRRPHLNIITAAMREIYEGAIDRLLITVPPQTGKTVTAVVGGAVWWLANQPTARVIIGSYGDSLAHDRGRETKRMVEECGHRFGLHLAYGSQAVQDWRLTSGGGVRSVGIGAGIAGYPGDIAFIDDPHKNREEADSLRSRDRAYKWLSADIISRLSPGAPVVMILTRWHPDDLAARVIADEGTTDTGGRWRVIRMPALCDDPENDPLGRAYGAPLPHPKIRVADTDRALAHWQDKRRGSTIQDWNALYMCNPRPTEGALLSRDLLRQRRGYAIDGGLDVAAKRVAVAIDPSGGGRDVAGIIGGYLGSDKRLYISHDASGVMASSDWARSACKLANQIDADMFVIEKNYGGDMATLAVRTAWDALQRECRDAARQRIIAENPNLRVNAVERLVDREKLEYGGLCPLLKTVTAKRNKRLRAEPIAQQWIEDRVRTAAYLPEMEEEWATWIVESSDSPGRLDASVYLAYALLPKPGSGSGGSAAPGGSVPSTTSSPLDRGSSGGGFGPLGR